MENSKYIPFNQDALEAVINPAGFIRNDLPRCHEMVYERPVKFNSGRELPFLIRLYSTVDVFTAETRTVGADAIRLILVSKEGKALGKAESRVYRTKSAFINLLERARELFKHAVSHQCHKCETGLMVARNGKYGQFYGCSNYPNCNNTVQVITE